MRQEPIAVQPVDPALVERAGGGAEARCEAAAGCSGARGRAPEICTERLRLRPRRRLPRRPPLASATLLKASAVTAAAAASLTASAATAAQLPRLELRLLRLGLLRLGLFRWRLLRPNGSFVIRDHYHIGFAHASRHA